MAVTAPVNAAIEALVRARSVGKISTSPRSTIGSVSGKRTSRPVSMST